MHTLQDEDELAELEVVLLPRPELPPGLRRGHVELHVLDLPDKGPPHCCGASEDSPPTRPPLGDLLRTPHP